MKGEYGRKMVHGLSAHPLMSIWNGIIQRCYNANSESYSNYGGRGIIMCDQWRFSFKNFYDWAINNGWVKGLYFDRIDNDGNYDPSNCRISSRAINNRNTRRNVMITFKGETLCLSDWATRIGISAHALKFRLKKWTIDEALLTPKTIKYDQTASSYR